MDETNHNSLNIQKSFLDHIYNMELIPKEEIEEKIQLIQRQTNYNEEQAREKLQYHNNDPIQVIKEYLGVAEKKAPIAKTKNQEIYRQIRSFIYVPPKNY